MTEIGAYDAKTHLPRLLERVQKGERFIITKHGRPVAELVPMKTRDTDGVRRAIGELHAIRKQLARRNVHLKDILREGETSRDLTHADHRY